MFCGDAGPGGRLMRMEAGVVTGRRAVPPLWYPVVALALSFVLSIIFLDISLSLLHGNPASALSSLTPFELGMNEVGLWVVFVGSAALAAKVYFGERFLQAVRWHLKPAVDIPVGVAAGVLAQLVVVPLLYLPVTLENPAVGRQLSAPAQTIVGIGAGSGIYVVAAILVIGAPVAEEIFFRGLTYRTILGHFTAARPWLRSVLAVGGSSLLFAIAHFEPLQFAGLFVVGCILAILVKVTGRLGTSIVAHASFNLVAVIALAHLR